jgi:hemerythrin-like domain-containing protein
MQHLWKENNRLFMMADMILQDKIDEVTQSLNEVEKSRLKEIGKSREDYEKLADDLDKKISVI